MSDVQRLRSKFAVLALAVCALAPIPQGCAADAPQLPPTPLETARDTWVSDNGNGTFTNPILYEDLCDPDMIRVGEDFYLVGSTMHVMPGLPILHSKDLVNWKLLGYVFDRLEMGPEYRLEGNKGAYGNGIWAPVLRHHKGTFYVFVNINDYGLQVFTAQNPAGPWRHHKLGGKIYDLGVLFDDDRIYAVHGYDEVHLTEVKPDLTGYVEGSDRVIIPKGNAMGEGHHFYKVGGKYYIVSANFAPVGRMQCARADKVDGPYETATISMRETMGWQRGNWVNNFGFWSPIPNPGDKVEVQTFGDNGFAAVPLHQGGIVDLPNGDWWGFSMMDSKSLGRMTYLSPVTWQDGWPYFGLPGNLGRSPRTWFKPDTGADVPPTPTYQRNDDFSEPALRPLWQWNHVPVDAKWSLTEKPGTLRLYTLPAPDFFRARNSLTQRAVGPESTATVALDATGLQPGDIAGLGLLAVPYSWIGIARTEVGFVLRWYGLLANRTEEVPLAAGRALLRVAGNFDTDLAQFAYSTDGGATFRNIGDAQQLGFSMKTFQGVRYALFGHNTAGREGGVAEFDSWRVSEPLADRSANVPLGKVVTLWNLGKDLPAYAHPLGMLHFIWRDAKEFAGPGTRFRVHDRGEGRVALESMDGRGFLTVVGAGLSADVRLMKTETKDSIFLWQDLLRRQCMLLSLKTNRYLGLDPATNEPYGADWPGTHPDRKDGTVFEWREAEAN